MRLPGVATRRENRTESRPLRLVWHDGAEAALTARGLIAESCHAGWRLLRMVPDAGPWPPATPPPILVAGDTTEALGEWPPLQPVAAFAGHRRTVRLAGGTTLMLLHGTISAVARDMPVASLTLHGPDALALAQEMAGDLGLAVPRASLPARAVALARGTAEPPRRLGAPEIQPDLSVADAFAHTVGWLVDAALYWAGRIGPDAGEVPVHQMRVALRRLNSALTLFRAVAPDDPSIAEAKADAKAIATALGPARDWDVFLAGSGRDVAAAFPADARIAGLLAAAERQRDAAYRTLARYFAGSEFRLATLRLAGFAALRPFLPSADASEIPMPWDEPVSAFAPPALDRRLKHTTGDPAQLDGAALHKLRKDAKRLRYAGEIFTPLYPGKTVRRWQKRVAALQAALGLLNDSAVTTTLTDQLGNGHTFARGAVQGFVAARASRARRKARDAWARFDRADPFWR